MRKRRPLETLALVAFASLGALVSSRSALGEEPASAAAAAPRAPATEPPKVAQDAPTQAAPEAELSLEMVVREALATNERAARAKLRVDTAEGQVVRARAAFLPQLSTGGTATFRPEADNQGRNLTLGATAQLNQPLVNLSAIPSYSQSKNQLVAEQEGSRQDVRVLAFDTARAFLQAKTTERLLEAAKQRVLRAKANQDNARARADAGLASVNDATRADLEVASASREVAQTEGQVNRAYIQVGFLMGRPVPGRLADTARVLDAAERTAGKAAELAKDAQARRPDVRAAEARSEAARKGAAEPLYRLAPTLNASANLRLTPDVLPNQPVADSTFLLSLSWTLFDGGARYGDRRTREAQARSTELDEKLLKRGVATEIGLALASLEAARESYRVAGDVLAAATKSGQETEILYKQGLARAIELTTANAQRFDAEVARATAKLQMEQAYLELRFALGVDAVGEGTK